MACFTRKFHSTGPNPRRLVKGKLIKIKDLAHPILVGRTFILNPLVAITP